jgi:hypothetical protein
VLVVLSSFQWWKPCSALGSRPPHALREATLLLMACRKRALKQPTVVCFWAARVDRRVCENGAVLDIPGVVTADRIRKSIEEPPGEGAALETHLRTPPPHPRSTWLPEGQVENHGG